MAQESEKTSISEIEDAAAFRVRAVARSELFGGLLKSLSHIVPSGLRSLLEVLPRLGSGFTKLVELVAGYLLLGLQVSQLFVPACLGLFVIALFVGRRRTSPPL